MLVALPPPASHRPADCPPPQPASKSGRHRPLLETATLEKQWSAGAGRSRLRERALGGGVSFAFGRPALSFHFHLHPLPSLSSPFPGLRQRTLLSGKELVLLVLASRLVFGQTACPPAPSPPVNKPLSPPFPLMATYRQQPSFDGSTHELGGSYQQAPYGGGGAGYEKTYPEPSRIRGGDGGAFLPSLLFASRRATWRVRPARWRRSRREQGRTRERGAASAEVVLPLATGSARPEGLLRRWPACRAVCHRRRRLGIGGRRERTRRRPTAHQRENLTRADACLSLSGRHRRLWLRAAAEEEEEQVALGRPAAAPARHHPRRHPRRRPRLARGQGQRQLVVGLDGRIGRCWRWLVQHPHLDRDRPRHGRR